MNYFGKYDCRFTVPVNELNVFAKFLVSNDINFFTKNKNIEQWHKYIFFYVEDPNRDFEILVQFKYPNIQIRR